MAISPVQILTGIMAGDTKPIDDFIRKVDVEWQATKDTLQRLEENDREIEKVCRDLQDEIRHLESILERIDESLNGNA